MPFRASGLTRVRAVADDSTHDVADCSALGIQTELTRDVAVCRPRFGERNDPGVPFSKGSATSLQRYAATECGVSLLGLNGEEWPHHRKNALSVRHVSQAPVVFGFPLRPVERDASHRPNAEARANRVDDHTFRAGNRHLKSNARQIHATLAVEKPGEPAGKLIVCPQIEHKQLYFGVPLPMGRAIARAVKQAIQKEAVA